MIKELAKALPDWSADKRTRCFAHIINLVAKSLLKQFDNPTKESEEYSNDERDLRELAAGLDEEEQQMLQETDADDDDMQGDDNEIGWVDELVEMNDDDRNKLLKSIRPVSRVLFKVFFCDYLPLILTNYLLASKARLQNNSFYHHYFAGLEVLSRSSKP
jgi:hypothetical protein